MRDGRSINMKQYCTGMKQFELQALNLHVALICFAANFRTEFVGRTAPVTRSPHLHAGKHVLVRALYIYLSFPMLRRASSKIAKTKCIAKERSYPGSSPTGGSSGGQSSFSADRLLGFFGCPGRVRDFHPKLICSVCFSPTRTLHTPFLIRCVHSSLLNC